MKKRNSKHARESVHIEISSEAHKLLLKEKERRGGTRVPEIASELIVATLSLRPTGGDKQVAASESDMTIGVRGVPSEKGS